MIEVSGWYVNNIKTPAENINNKKTDAIINKDSSPILNVVGADIKILLCFANLYAKAVNTITGPMKNPSEDINIGILISAITLANNKNPTIINKYEPT
jgi:hypothetical protein